MTTTIIILKLDVFYTLFIHCFKVLYLKWAGTSRLILIPALFDRRPAGWLGFHEEGQIIGQMKNKTKSFLSRRHITLQDRNICKAFLQLARSRNMVILVRTLYDIQHTLRWFWMKKTTFWMKNLPWASIFPFKTSNIWSRGMKYWYQITWQFCAISVRGRSASDWGRFCPNLGHITIYRCRIGVLYLPLGEITRAIQRSERNKILESNSSAVLWCNFFFNVWNFSSPFPETLYTHSNVNHKIGSEQ